MQARTDFGFSVSRVRSIATVLPIALNGGTLRTPDFEPLADLEVELIRNFYPRGWNGLVMSSVSSSVALARQFGWRLGAFIAGDSMRRLPLTERLPTVEEHRTMPPLFQAVALVDAAVDDAYVGCPVLTDHSWWRLGLFVPDDVIMPKGIATPAVRPLAIEALAIPDRPDAAEAMIRLKHSRQQFDRLPLPEVGGQPRPADR